MKRSKFSVPSISKDVFGRVHYLRLWKPFEDGPKCLFAWMEKSGAKFEIHYECLLLIPGGVCEYLSRHVEYIWIEKKIHIIYQKKDHLQRAVTWNRQDRHLWKLLICVCPKPSFWLFGLVPRRQMSMCFSSKRYH